MSEVEVKRFLCNNGIGGCWALCGLQATVDKKTGKIVNIEGNPDHPISQGRHCLDRVTYERMTALLYHPQQLKYPVERVGERGENMWRRITWDEALDKIAAKLEEIKEKYGPECIAMTEGTYRSDMYWLRTRFLVLYGNPINVGGVGVMCFCNDVAMQRVMLGGPIWFPTRHDVARCIVLQGTSGRESMPSIWWGIEDLKRKNPNLRMISIDPRLTHSGMEAYLWLQIRPGTDGALYMSWLNIIINEELYDKEFVEKWTNAPFLVRSDTNRTLVEKDLKPDGSPDRYVVWDTVTEKPAIWDPDAYEYSPKGAKPALAGTYTVKLATKEEVECKTVWQRLIERVSEYTPERASEITWIPSDKIVESARMYATFKPATFQWCVATDQLGLNATRIEQMRIILRMICGYLDVSEPVTRTNEIIDGKKPLHGFDLQLTEEIDKYLPHEQRMKQLGADRFKLMTWPTWEIMNPIYEKRLGHPKPYVGHEFQIAAPLIYEAILTGKPYPIKALIQTHCNTMVNSPNTRKVYRAMKSPNLELNVVLEFWMTPTAEMADIVLPCASKLEREFVDTFEDFWADVYVSDKAVEPLGERRSKYYFWKGLADRLGFGEYFPWKTWREAAEHRLKPLGMTITEMAQKGKWLAPFKYKQYQDTNPRTDKPFGFITPSGKAEVWSIVLEKLDYDPLPDYQEPPESPISTPEVAKEYPFILITGGRHRPFFHSEGRQFGAGFREQHPDPLVDINYITARELGIANGDWVWIETRRGRIMQRARLHNGIHPQVINAQHGWWFPELPGEDPWLHGVFRSNACVHSLDGIDTLDPLAGGWPNRALLCKVYKA